MLKLEKLSKIYVDTADEVPAIENITFEAKEGEFVCVIGPNGCGKSTILRLISGIVKPSSGKLSATNNISYLPQQSSLLPWRTAKENLLLPGQIKDLNSRAIKREAEKLLADFGLAEFKDFYPSTLSGGMQQKVALIRAVITNPEVLLLDEPFSSLDAITRLEMQEWLLALWQLRRPTVICVTHDIREAIFLADKIIVLTQRPGKILKQIDVRLPRPRKRKHLNAQNSLSLENKLQELLLS